MRKMLFILAVVLGFQVLSIAQMFDPVHWEQEIKSLGNNEYELIFKATIDKGWSISVSYTHLTLPTSDLV